MTPRKTPWEIAVEWYSEPTVRLELTDVDIPRDVSSPEFLSWLTHQYRLAMFKGIQLGRSGE